MTTDLRLQRELSAAARARASRMPEVAHPDSGTFAGKTPPPLLANPHTETLMPGVFLVAGANLTHPWDANAILVDGGKGKLALIDAGSTFGYPNLKKNIESLGYTMRDLQTVIVTHAHWDHASGLRQLKKDAPQAQICVHQADAPLLEKGNRHLTATDFYCQPRFPTVRPDRVLHGGERIKVGDRTLRIVHTPGHTLGSISVLGDLDGHTVAFTGDTLYGGINPGQSDLLAWADSLARLQRKKPDELVIGHAAERVLHHGTEHIREARDEFCRYPDPWGKTEGRKGSYEF